MTAAHIDMAATGQVARYADESMAGLASLCAVCGPEGATGPECTGCFIAADVQFERSQDV